MNEDPPTSSLVIAASAIWPGLLTLILVVSVRSWTWRTRYLGKSGKGRRKRLFATDGGKT